MMPTEEYEKAHLYFNIVDVRCETEGNFCVVCVVFAVSNVDVHVNLVFVCSDHHSGEINKKKLSAGLVVMHMPPHKGAVTHW